MIITVEIIKIKCQVFIKSRLQASPVMMWNWYKLFASRFVGIHACDKFTLRTIKTNPYMHNNGNPIKMVHFVVHCIFQDKCKNQQFSKKGVSALEGAIENNYVIYKKSFFDVKLQHLL